MNIPPSLDFPSARSTLTASEIATKFSCTEEHVINLIRDGSMVSGKSKAKAALLAQRISAEDYRRFLTKRRTNGRPIVTTASVPWPSIDIPGTNALTPAKIAQALSFSPEHVIGLIEEDSLIAFDMKTAASGRSYYRVTVEAYRQFIEERTTPQRAV